MMTLIRPVPPEQLATPVFLGVTCTTQPVGVACAAVTGTIAAVLDSAAMAARRTSTRRGAT
jgi:hypothetical protein